MVTSALFEPIVFDGSDTITDYNLALSDQNLTSIDNIVVTLIFVNDQGERERRRLQAGNDYAIIGNGVTAYTLALVNPAGVGNFIVVDRQEPALAARRFRDGGQRFPGALIEGGLSQLARAGQDSGRLAVRGLRLSPLDGDIDTELPPLPDDPQIVVVQRGQSPRMLPADNIETLAVHADAIGRLGDSDVLDALGLVGNDTAQQNLQIVADDRANVDIVAGEISRVRIAASANVQALMAEVTNPDNLTLFSDVRNDIPIFRTLNNNMASIQAVAMAQNRSAINRLADTDNLDRVGRVDAELSKITDVHDRLDAIDVLTAPAILNQFDVISDPVNLSATSAVAGEIEAVRTVDAMSGKISQLTSPIAMAGISTLSEPENLQALRTNQLNSNNIRRVGSNINDVSMVADNVEEIVQTPTMISNAFRGVDAIARDDRLNLVLRNANVISDLRGDVGSPSRVVVDFLNGNSLDDTPDVFLGDYGVA